MPEQENNITYKINYYSTDKSNKIGNILRIWLWIAIILLVLLIGVAFICPFATEVLAERTIFISENLTKKELSSLIEIVGTNKIHTIDFVTERIISFYEMLIAYLLGLFAFAGVLGYLYIKNSHKADVQEEILTVVHSQMFSDLTNIEVKRVFSEEKKAGGELYKIVEYIENLTDRVEFLEEVVNNEDITIKVKSPNKQKIKFIKNKKDRVWR